jgi:hypothetical protein
MPLLNANALLKHNKKGVSLPFYKLESSKTLTEKHKQYCPQRVEGASGAGVSLADPFIISYIMLLVLIFRKISDP